MAKGENIFKRKDGRWEARYIKGYELSGKTKYGFCYGKTYREAKEKVTKCKAGLSFAAASASLSFCRTSLLCFYDSINASYLQQNLIRKVEAL